MSSVARPPLAGPRGLVLLGLFALVASALGLCIGTSGIGAGDVVGLLTGGEVPDHAAQVVWEWRLPRVLLGLLVGAALSVAGLLIQALLQNDLAEPYLIGVGPGALLGVTVAAVVVGAGTMPPAAIRGVFAFGGALLVAVLVFGFARRTAAGVVTSVLLAGIGVGAFVSAISTALLHMNVPDWADVVRWLLGSLELSQLGDAVLLGAILLAVGGLAFVRARDLDVLTLGEESAWLAGVPIRSTLWIVGGGACLLAAAAVALSGLVGFVGLVVPHLTRRLCGPGHRGAIPAAALLGGGLLVLADALARTVHPPAGLPLGVVTALLGAPVLVWLIARRR